MFIFQTGPTGSIYAPTPNAKLDLKWMEAQLSPLLRLSLYTGQEDAIKLRKSGQSSSQAFVLHPLDIPPSVIQAASQNGAGMADVKNWLSGKVSELNTIYYPNSPNKMEIVQNGDQLALKVPISEAPQIQPAAGNVEIAPGTHVNFTQRISTVTNTDALLGAMGDYAKELDDNKELSGDSKTKLLLDAIAQVANALKTTSVTLESALTSPSPLPVSFGAENETAGTRQQTIQPQTGQTQQQAEAVQTQAARQQAEIVPETPHETAQAVQAETAQVVQQQGGKKDAATAQSEEEILKDMTAAYRRMEEFAAKAGSGNKSRIKGDLGLADNMLETANETPEGQRAPKYAEILSMLNYEYGQIAIVESAANADEKKTAKTRMRTKDSAKPAAVKGDKIPAGEWKKSFSPTINPDVKYGVVGIEMEKHEVKLQVILGDAKDFVVIYPEFEREGRTPKNRESGLVVPKLGADSNWVYNPGTYFKTHENFAAITSGTYLVKGDEGISYPIGGIKINGTELEPARQSAFENDNDPRNAVFNSKYSPATMGWVSTFYIDKGGKAGIKSSLDVSENERKQWPTWIEIGKTLVSGGKSTMQDEAADRDREYRMVIAIIGGKVGIITTKEPVLRKDFAKALEKIPGLEFAAQLDGSTSSQTAVRCPDKDVKSVSGRGTINLFGFTAGQTVSEAKNEGKESEPDNTN